MVLALTITPAVLLLPVGLVILHGLEKSRDYWIGKLEDIKIFSDLVHAKLYVDGELGVGSANYTVSGLRKNTEAIIWVNAEYVEDAVRKFKKVERGLEKVGFEELLRSKKKERKRRK